jgi:hypothetical protein
MHRRLAHVVVLTAMVAALVAVQGAQVASGDEGDDPVGYHDRPDRVHG